MPRSILGISAYYHDSAAALIVDGEVIAAAQEERFTRIKHDASFPAHAEDAPLPTTTTPASADAPVPSAPVKSAACILPNLVPSPTSASGVH